MVSACKSWAFSSPRTEWRKPARVRMKHWKVLTMKLVLMAEPGCRRSAIWSRVNAQPCQGCGNWDSLSFSLSLDILRSAASVQGTPAAGFRHVSLSLSNIGSGGEGGAAARSQSTGRDGRRLSSEPNPRWLERGVPVEIAWPEYVGEGRSQEHTPRFWQRGCRTEFFKPAKFFGSRWLMYCKMKRKSIQNSSHLHTHILLSLCSPWELINTERYGAGKFKKKTFDAFCKNSTFDFVFRAEFTLSK